jgi:hypothetical protein
MRRILQPVLYVALALAVPGRVVLAPATAHAQTLSKRLVLRDGSYQSVREWQVQGDRVHYYSVERSGWEDIPKELIDWDATNKYNTELSTSSTPRSSAVKEADAEEKAERAKEEAASPQVAPGVRLPSMGGVFMLDTWRGQPQLVEMVQMGSEINKQTGKNILRAAINPLPMGSKQTIELKGAHAKVQGHEQDPEFYVNVDQPEAQQNANASVNTWGTSRDLDLMPDRYRIVRVESKKDARIVGNLKVAIYGKVTEQQKYIKTTAAPVSGGWVKIVPAEPLTPGEYALIEMLSPKEMNLYVWDFGVNPTAPQNGGAWKPTTPPPVSTGSTDSPILKRPPKP